MFSLVKVIDGNIIIACWAGRNVVSSDDSARYKSIYSASNKIKVLW